MRKRRARPLVPRGTESGTPRGGSYSVRQYLHAGALAVFLFFFPKKKKKKKRSETLTSVCVFVRVCATA